MYRPACKECAIPDFHCECINNECQKVKGTSIKVSGTVEPDPKYVIVNITLPVDNIEEAKLIAAKTCDDTFDEFTEIEEKDNFWIISRTTPNYSDFDVKINKYDGNTECILYG